MQKNDEKKKSWWLRYGRLFIVFLLSIGLILVLRWSLDSGGISTNRGAGGIRVLKNHAPWILPLLISFLLLFIVWCVILKKDYFKNSRKRPLFSMFMAVVAGIGLVLTAVFIGRCCQYLGFLSELEEAIKANPPWTLIGGIVVAPAILLTWYWRHEHKEADLENTADQMREDLFVKGAELLGRATSEQQVSGIYALELISKKSAYYHDTVIEMLCAYVRLNAPWKAEKENEKNARPAIGIQIAMQIIGRRSEERRKQEEKAEYKLDLHGTDLRGVDLSEAHLENAILYGSHLDESNLYRAHLEGAMLNGTHFDRAYLTATDFAGADLSSADLRDADMKDVRLNGHKLYSKDLSGALNLTQEQINSALGNKHTKLPKGLKVPEAWLADDVLGNENTIWPEVKED